MHGERGYCGRRIAIYRNGVPVRTRVGRLLQNSVSRGAGRARIHDRRARSRESELPGSVTRATRGLDGYEAMAVAIDEHLRFCLDAPDHVRAFYILWFESVAPKSPLKKVMSDIHDRRRRDVAKWIREGVARAAPQPVLPPDAIAGQFNTAIVGIVYHWLQHPDDTEGVVQLHRDLKESMKILLAVPEVHQLRGSE